MIQRQFAHECASHCSMLDAEWASSLSTRPHWPPTGQEPESPSPHDGDRRHREGKGFPMPEPGKTLSDIAGDHIGLAADHFHGPEVFFRILRFPLHQRRRGRGRQDIDRRGAPESQRQDGPAQGADPLQARPRAVMEEARLGDGRPRRTPSLGPLFSGLPGGSLCLGNLGNRAWQRRTCPLSGRGWGPFNLIEKRCCCCLNSPGTPGGDPGPGSAGGNS